MPSYAEGIEDAETFYQFDALGNVVSRLNLAGEVVSNDAYDAWGTLLARSGTANDPFGYKGEAGYYTDAETGLVLCTLRYYDPATGRWLTRDPIGYAGGINLYGYCLNDPIGGIDPLGLSSMDSGSSGPRIDLFDLLTDGAAGAGDVLSLGATKWIREQMGVDDVVSYDSTAYRVGEVTGTLIGVVDAAVGGVAAVRAIMQVRNAGKAAIVLGQTMERVERTAARIGAETYGGFRIRNLPGVIQGVCDRIHNGCWLLKKVAQGYDVYSVGFDAARAGIETAWSFEKGLLEFCNISYKIIP